MRKLIFTPAILLSIAALSFRPVTPTAECFDCQSVRDTCSEASVPIYNACRAGGASHENCELDQVNWYNNCVRANGCWPVNN